MYVLQFTLAIILLAICYVVSYYFSSNGTKSNPIIKPQNINKRYPVVVIIGATSSLGQEALNLLKDRKLTLIAVSRRETRWLKIKDEYPTVAWYRGDIRLSQEIDYLFEQIKLNYGRIDYVVNLTYIPGKASVTPISSLRVKEHVYCKLSKSYDTELLPHSHAAGAVGEESPLFTNIIGMVVLKNACVHFKIPNVILILGADPVVNELINSIINESNGVTKFISLEPKSLSKKLNKLID